jgi:FAD binding domain-containing protein
LQSTGTRTPQQRRSWTFNVVLASDWVTDIGSIRKSRISYYKTCYREDWAVTAGTEIARIPVAIVGGGSVGLMLALFLDFYGVRSILLNSEEATRWHPKGSTEGSRTMEHFRRLGLAGQIRKLGLPADHPTDVAGAKD